MITKIVDIETDDIDASLIHCIAIGDTEGKVIVYADSLDYPPLSCLLYTSPSPRD